MTASVITHTVRPTAAHDLSEFFSATTSGDDDASLRTETTLATRTQALLVQEQYLQSLMRSVLESSDPLTDSSNTALRESMEAFATHGRALTALLPPHNDTIRRPADRFRFALARACNGLATYLARERCRQAMRLHELYTVVSETAIHYVSLQATALSLGDRCAAAVAARHLRHCGTLLLALHNVVPSETVRELQRFGLPARVDSLSEVSGMTLAL